MEEPTGQRACPDKYLGRMALDEHDLRLIAGRFAALGDYSVGVFDEVYPDLNAFLLAREAPYRELSFKTTTLAVHLSGKSAIIAHAHDSNDKAQAMSTFLKGFREAPLVEYRYAHGGILYVLALMAVYTEQLHLVALCFVVFAIFNHILEETMARKAILRRPQGPLRNPQMTWALLGVGMVIATVLKEISGN